MQVFVIGAGGGVGRRLSSILTARGDDVTGMHRNPQQSARIEATGATPLVADLVADSVGDLAERLAGHDAVVFSAGAHGTGVEHTTEIDGEGLKKTADAALHAGVRRVVVVSVFPDAGRGREPVNERFEHYIRVKKDADVYLTRTDLDWVVVRPGTLLDTPGGGFVEAGPAVPYGDVHRDDVAAFLDAVLHEPGLSRQIVELTSGSEPVAAAARRLARG